MVRILMNLVRNVRTCLKALLERALTLAERTWVGVCYVVPAISG